MPLGTTKANKQVSKRADRRYATFSSLQCIRSDLKYISGYPLCPPVDQDDCPQTVPIKGDNCSAESSDSAVQKDEELGETLEAALSAINTQARNINSLAYACPYHGPILQLCKPLTNKQDQSPMQRYLAEGIVEQPSLFIGVDGRTSMYKGCACWKIVNAALQGKAVSSS